MAVLCAPIRIEEVPERDPEGRLNFVAESERRGLLNDERERVDRDRESQSGQWGEIPDEFRVT